MDARVALDALVATGAATVGSEVTLRLRETGRGMLSAPLAFGVLVDATGTASAMVHSGVSVDDLARCPTVRRRSA